MRESVNAGRFVRANNRARGELSYKSVSNSRFKKWSITKAKTYLRISKSARRDGIARPDELLDCTVFKLSPIPCLLEVINPRMYKERTALITQD
jgi:hypothetical protein